MTIVNETTGLLVCQHVVEARSWWSRTRGLLGRPPLEAEEALWIEPCQGVHMFFMRYPIDVIFLDAQGGVVALREGLRPWRMTRIYRGAQVALELAPGAIGRAAVQPGHRLRRFSGLAEGSR